MKTFPFLFASLLLSSAAFANPVMIVQELSAQVVAGPHVKLTLTYNYGGSDVTTHGTSHSPWASAGSTSRDTGSGGKELTIVQMCDCHVPPSTTLDYKVGDGRMWLGIVRLPRVFGWTGKRCRSCLEITEKRKRSSRFLSNPGPSGLSTFVTRNRCLETGPCTW